MSKVKAIVGFAGYKPSKSLTYYTWLLRLYVLAFIVNAIGLIFQHEQSLIIIRSALFVWILIWIRVIVWRVRVDCRKK